VFPRSSQVDQSPLEENRANIILREDEHEFKQIKDNLIEDDPPLESEKREVIVEMIDRDHRIIEDVKRIYDNRCQICGFTFKEKNGEFYSEGHHLIPLSEGGTQERDNIVILCPNHHRMIHYADVEIDDLKHEKREVKINGDTHVIVY
jgi:predicted restriction endonuclease